MGVALNSYGGMEELGWRAVDVFSWGWKCGSKLKRGKVFRWR